MLDNDSVVDAEAVITRGEGWSVNVTFAPGEFVSKVAVPYEGEQIAIVLSGVVVSAPTLGPGIMGDEVLIPLDLTEAEAQTVAAAIAAE